MSIYFEPEANIELYYSIGTGSVHSLLSLVWAKFAVHIFSMVYMVVAAFFHKKGVTFMFIGLDRMSFQAYLFFKKER